MQVDRWRWISGIKSWIVFKRYVGDTDYGHNCQHVRESATDYVSPNYVRGHGFERNQNKSPFLEKNKCIGDDTKAAARQSPNCIKNKKNKIWRKTIFNMADGIITPCNAARS